MSPIMFSGGGGGSGGDTPELPCPILKWRGVARSETRQENFSERLTDLLACRFELGRSSFPRLTAKLSKPRCTPGGAFLFVADRAVAGWRNQTYSSQISKHLSDFEAGAVTESETEAERLRAQARRALELARAINDLEAALRLKAHAAELLERADGLDERKGEN